MLKHDRIYRGVSSILVALFVVSALMAVLAFATPQPARAKGGITPQWTQCYDQGCNWNSPTCKEECINHELNVWKYHEWLCYSDGVGWYWYYLHVQNGSRTLLTNMGATIEAPWQSFAPGGKSIQKLFSKSNYSGIKAN